MSLGLENLNTMWLAVIFIPLMAALLFSFKKLHKVLILLTPFCALPALCVSIFLQPESEMLLSWMFFESKFVLDPTGKVFLFFTSALWLLAGWYSISYIGNHRKRIRYFICFLMAMSGNFGLIIAQDVFSFYFLFALMSFASYGLVVHEQSKEASFAGSVYLTLVVVGEAFVFSGLLLLAHSTGTIYISEAVSLMSSVPECRTIIWLMFFGFGVKAGALPLHVWLPLAHPVAPTPASAVLSGSMIKAGLLGWIRFLPLGFVAISDIGNIIVMLGILAALYAAIVGLTQKKIKAVLAYSSISQMGMMTILIGIGFIKPEIWDLSWKILMVYATHHALTKGALFLSVGTAALPIKSTVLRFLRDIAVIWPALTVIGISFTSGELAKGGLKFLLKKSSDHMILGEGIMFLVTVSSLTTALIMVRFLWLVWEMKKKNNHHLSSSLGLNISWLILVGMVLFFPIGIQMQELITLKYFNLNVSLKNVWPLIAAIGLVWMFFKLRVSKSFKIVQGDVLYVYMMILRQVPPLTEKFIYFIQKSKSKIVRGIVEVIDDVTDHSHRIDLAVLFFNSWKTFGISILALSVFLMLIMM